MGSCNRVKHIRRVQALLFGVRDREDRNVFLPRDRRQAAYNLPHVLPGVQGSSADKVREGIYHDKPRARFVNHVPELVKPVLRREINPPQERRHSVRFHDRGIVD